MTEKIYLASIYSSHLPLNHRIHNSVLGKRFNAAVDACAWLLMEGYIVYCPIVHWHPVATRHRMPKDRDFWGDQDDAMLEWCDRLVILKTIHWDKSYGIQEDILRAIELGKEVSYLAIRSNSYRQMNKIPKYRLEPHNESTAAGLDQ